MGSVGKGASSSTAGRTQPEILDLNDYARQFYGIGVDDLTDEDYDRIDAEYRNWKESQNFITIREAVQQQEEADRKYVVGDGNVKPSQVEVSVDYYKGTVGNPRGYGNWAFFPDAARDDLDNAIFVSGSYGDAKNKAKKEAAKRGWGRLYLGT